jgi:hypothetical protein
MRLFATKWFTRFARSERIADDALCEAIARAERGLIDADLGRGLIKQRVARHRQGRSGGFRVLIAYRRGTRGVFLYGFAKRERDNIRSDQLAAWQTRAQEVLASRDDVIDRNVADGNLREVHCGQEEKNQPNG